MLDWAVLHVRIRFACSATRKSALTPNFSATREYARFAAEICQQTSAGAQKDENSNKRLFLRMKHLKRGSCGFVIVMS